MNTFDIDVARRRQTELIDQAREERLAASIRRTVPGAWGRLALRAADLMIGAGESLRSRYRRPAASRRSRGWA